MPPFRLAALSFLLVFAIMVTAGSAGAQAIGAGHHAPELRAKKKCTLKKKAKCKKTTVSKQKIGKQNLSGSNLSGAVITGSTFTGTNLRNVDLSNAKLTNVTFKNTDLGGVKLTGATLVNVRFDHVDASVGSSGRACELLTSPEKMSNFGCFAPGFNADGANIKGGFISNSELSRSSWRNATFDNTMFIDCTLDDARFDGADFGTGYRGGIAGLIPSQPRANARRARFDDSKHLFLDHVNVENGSFLGAEIFHLEDSTLTDARGLQGSRTVTVSNAPGFALVPKLIQIKETGYWRVGNLCLTARTCSYTAAVGSPLQILVRSVIPFSVSGAGLTCTQALLGGSSTTTCVGDSLPAGNDPLAVTFGPYDPSPPPAPAVVTKTVSFSLFDVSLSPSAVAIDFIKIQQVTSGGTVTATHTCSNASTCSTSFPVGSLVRFAFTDSYNVSPFRWIVLNDGASTTIGPSPFVDQVTPAFELTTDVALTAALS